MIEIIDKLGLTIGVTEEYVEKLANKIPPITIDIVRDVLKDADYIYKSKNKDQKDHRCYYLLFDKEKGLYYKVVVKYIKGSSEHWLVTGHVSKEPKETEVINHEDDI